MVANNMNSTLQILVSFALGAAVAITCDFLYVSSSPCGRSLQILAWSNGTTQGANSHYKVSDGANNTRSTVLTSEETKGTTTTVAPLQKGTTFEGLAQLLKSAAMDDNTVIMTVINKAWAAPDSLLDLFLESFHVGDQIEHLLNHLIIVSMDPIAYDRCKVVHAYCYFLKVEGVNFAAEKVYMSKDYLEMMWSRNKFQRSILEMGYNFLFTDVDIIWLRDPFRHISVAAHITISSDVFYGNPDDLENRANGGFLYAKSSKKTIEFFENWYLAREKYPNEHEQYIFDKIKYEFPSRFGVKIQFLDTAYCGGFCQPKKDFSKICTFHANCRVGLVSKLNELRNLLEGWNKYKAGVVEKSYDKNDTTSS